MSKRSLAEYNDSSIQVLHGLEAVVNAPVCILFNRYGPHHLVYEIVDNAVDEALAGFAN